MAVIRNAGTATMRFKEGLIASGSDDGISLDVYGDVSNQHIATFKNDQASSGHVMMLKTDGNGSASRILEMEDGDGDIVFRARADGRFGFGPDGVSSMGAGTFVVGIDNSSHTADIAISQRLQHLGDSNTYLDFPSADTFNLVAGGNSFLKYDGNVLINNANADVDMKVMGDDGNVILHVDAGTNKVGIGTTSPTEVLTLDATEPTILFKEGGTDMATIGVNSSDNILIQNKTINKHIVFKVNDQGVVREGFRINGTVPEVVVNEGSDSLVDFRVESNNSTHMLFVDGGNERVGIKTDVPVCELDVNGTVRTKGFGVNVRDVNSTSSVDALDYVLRCIQNQAITITLPAKNTSSGRILIFKDVLGNAGTNNITIDGDSSDTIDGNATFVMNQNRQSVTLVCDGINGWMITGMYIP